MRNNWDRFYCGYTALTPICSEGVRGMHWQPLYRGKSFYVKTLNISGRSHCCVPNMSVFCQTQGKGQENQAQRCLQPIAVFSLKKKKKGRRRSANLSWHKLQEECAGWTTHWQLSNVSFQCCAVCALSAVSDSYLQFF
jgi:hypothetical protein